MEKIWYYMNADKTKYGPFTDRELVGLIQHEILNEDASGDVFRRILRFLKEE